MRRFIWLSGVLGLCGFLLVTAGEAQALVQQVSPTGIAGLVTADKAPAGGVVVRAFRPGESTALSSATTGADGKFQLNKLVQGVYRIEFSRDGFETNTRFGIVVLEGVMGELNVTLTRAAGTPAAAQSSAESQGSLRPGEVAVRIETAMGTIVLAIDVPHAPVTAANFLKYVDGGFYNGGRFHRATRPDNYKPAPPDRPMMEIIQGGINPDRRSGAFPPIALERTSVTGLKHVRGTVSMARATAADTATSDFFILLDDQPSLDFGGKRFDDGQGGAAFGRVISGLDVVRKIQQQPVQAQSLTPPIAIVTVKRQ